MAGRNRWVNEVTERKPFEFFLLRYVPNVAREEFVNIGLLMTEEGAPTEGFAEVHFTRDWKRARCLFPDTDTHMLDGVCKEIEARVANAGERAAVLAELNDRCSNVIQLSALRSCQTDDPAREMKDLIKMFLEAPGIAAIPQEERARKNVGVKWIHSVMQEEFQAGGFWSYLERNLAASPYTVPNDPLKFDFAFSLKNEIRLFQAVSLVEQPQRAVDFAFHYGVLAPRMAQLTQRQPILTMVVEDHYDANDERVQLALAVAEKENGKVTRLAGFREIVERSRLELKAANSM